MRKLRDGIVVMAAALAGVVCFGETAQAGPISYSYSGTPASQLIHPNPGLKGGISFVGQTGVGFGASGGAYGEQLIAVASNRSGVVGSFDHVAYTTGLSITDSTAPGSPHTFLFSGQFNGALTPGSNTLTNTFTTPTTQSFQLGSHLYTVTINPVALPSIGTNGAVTYDVHVSSVPEPSTLLLSGIGALSVGFVSWRRRNAAGRTPRQSAPTSAGPGQ